MDVPGPAVGERWGYRARSVDRLVEVEVLRIGTKRPARVLVRFIDDAQEGREDWVPPSRLKVPWAGAYAWQAADDRWAAARAACGPHRDSVEDNAAWLVFEALPNDELVDLGFNRDSGLVFVSDADRLCGELGLTPADLDHPAAFHDGERLVLPWPVGELIFRRLAERNAERVLAAVRQSEHRAEQRALWGQQYGRDWYVSPEHCAEADAQYQPVLDLVRAWCGDAAIERADELLALREEVLRLGRIAEEAITALRTRGEKALANRLERELGVPLSLINGNDDTSARNG